MHNLNNYRLDTEWNDLYRSHKYFEEPKKGSSRKPACILFFVNPVI